ncbi:uncharacterized protein LOC110679341 [Aedes aegypti]|uniref:Uncharacterized protein n=1 Tax=Aedes aegypti TaxID=7159 RepID=A0A6I8TYS0_AEDAE|nr:uncharacterized protein LOC110679341 [Aedes aegypti]
MDSNGLPVRNLFKANTPYKMASDLKSYPVGNYAYVQMAIPLSKEAAPYVIYHACSNNKFSYNDVLNRWNYTESLLKSHGITVLANASDGDTRLMKAMRIRAGFDRPCTPSPWGPWFRVDWFSKTPINVQDMTHTINKLRNRMLNGDMTIGKYKIKKEHLKQLIENHSKDKHGLCMSDINLKDKMKFDSTEKLMKLDLEYFMTHVPNSKGTVLFIDLMRRMYRSFDKTEHPFLERIEDIWTSLFIVRGWRNFCKQKYNNLAECITPNAYHCLELDAHALILFICICRDNEVPEQCIIDYLSSQPCEKLFRELRSLSSTHQTVVNFSIKELTEKLKRIYMTRCIMYENRDRISYPYIDAKQHNQSSLVLPSNDDIIRKIEKCKTNAEQNLLEVGIEKAMIDLNDSVCNHAIVPRIEFVGIEESFEEEVEEEEEDEEDDVVAGTPETQFVGVKDCFEGENVEHEDVIQSKELEEANCCHQSDEFQNITLTNTLNEDLRPVYDANKVFTNCEELNIKNSVSGQKHTFRISDSNGQIKNVKKSTLLWMLTDGRNRLSSDRMRRFQQK